MDTSTLKRFAQEARRQLLDQVGARLEQVLRTDSAELREKRQTLEELQKQMEQASKRAMIDQVAYTWFNRFCALRFMDVNHYTRVGIVSPAEGFTQPEILQEAKQGLIDDWLKVDRQRVLDLLSGRATSANPQQEAYRLLLVAACNAYHEQMPFLFQPIEDYTELLMPEDLLSESSILQAMRDALTPEACLDVEVIGWLYQFYISERKDEVFANLKKNKKIQPEDIPAATQLFTPHWIVRYLVENSLGRLWMLNHPESKLVEQMDYYIRPEQEETDILEIGSPEEIKVCDPACGSGHMLTYAFDLLNLIYEEQGYDPIEIPRRILENNLYGIEIDPRAGHLAAFALMMKARERNRRFFSRGVEPNICVLENVAFSEGELDAYMDALGRDLFTQDLQETLTQFEQADNFGSLIQPKVKDVAFIRQRIHQQGVFEDLFLHRTNEKVLKVLEQVEFLSPVYQLVVTNPPYMGAKSMTPKLKEWAKSHYPSSKYDLFAMFVERNLLLAKRHGFVAMITMQSWMFLSTYENLRNAILESGSIVSMAHLGARAFDSIGGEVVSTTAFVIAKGDARSPGTFIDLREGKNEAKKSEILSETPRSHLYEAKADDFKRIPGSPIAYWATESIFAAFSGGKSISDVALPKQGLSTRNNDLFLRQWHEVDLGKIGFDCESRRAARLSRKKWFPYNKGGPFRKWYGNNEHVLNWKDDGKDIHEYSDLPLDYNGAPVRGKDFYFKTGMTWSSLAGTFSGRLSPIGFAFDAKGPVLFSIDKKHPVNWLMGLFNSKAAMHFLKVLAPTLDFNQGPVGRMPLPMREAAPLHSEIETLTKLEKLDWDSYETSWGFTSPPLLHPDYRKPTLEATYKQLRAHWQEVTVEMRRLEHEINRVFIDAYGLEDELTPQVPLSEITLNCNPHYRFGGDKGEQELEELLLADTARELISYSVGCMFGRYSLDKPGLILANQGETNEDYRKQVPDPTFAPDDDNVIPILDEGWFEDDIVERFKRFLRVTFGTEHFDNNLTFLEEAIGKDIRSYFLKSFYSEHVKMYKKRPIYWLFSSPNSSFNALIYMHRYRPDTVSVILNDYLRQYREKLLAHRTGLEQMSSSPSASQSEKTKALKEADKVGKILTELKECEDEILYPLASQQVEIDLDDGVKVNYNKFGKALKHVSGLSE